MSVFINFLDMGDTIVNWMLTPIFTVFLAIDGIVYSLVAYSYRLFLLMTQLNFNVIYSWIAPLIDRLQAVIMVFIMFKLGYALITYMINPDKSTDAQMGGVSLIKNVAICTGLLIIYTTVFSLLNELSLLIIGVPEGYEFSTLNQIFDVEKAEEKDSGLISRFIFGPEKTQDLKNFGNYLSTSVLSIFLYTKDKDNPGILDRIYSKMQKTEDISEFELMEITSVASDIGFGTGGVAYKFPILSTAIGAYIVYTIGSIAIEVGIRMFKLIVLQILAPVAIVSILDKGTSSPIWKNFLKEYGSAFVSVFVRVAGLFITCALISMFWNDKSQLTGGSGEGFVTEMFLFIIIVIAGFKFSASLPAFIDSVLGTKLADSKSAGLGSFLKGAVGGVVGGGVALGASMKNGSGFFGGLANTSKGLFSGTKTGFTGKGLNDYLSGLKGISSKATQDSIRYNEYGGLGASTLDKMGFGPTKKIENYTKANEAIKGLMDARVNAIKDTEADKFGDGTKIKYGSDSNAFADKYADHDLDVINAQSELENMMNGGDVSGYRPATQQEIDAAEDAIRKAEAKKLSFAGNNHAAFMLAAEEHNALVESKYALERNGVRETRKATIDDINKAKQKVTEKRNAAFKEGKRKYNEAVNSASNDEIKAHQANVDKHAGENISSLDNGRLSEEMKNNSIKIGALQTGKTKPSK